MSAQSTSSLPRVNTSFLPILLKGHERSITTVKYNQDGDLIFTAAKDNTPTAWYADTGERLGTYEFHRGAVSTFRPFSMIFLEVSLSIHSFLFHSNAYIFYTMLHAIHFY